MPGDNSVDSMLSIGGTGSTMFSKVCFFGGAASAVAGMTNMFGMDPHSGAIFLGAGMTGMALGVGIDMAAIGDRPPAKGKK